VTFDERMAAEGVVRFWREEQPEAFLVEQIVYSERLGVAGRLDFYGIGSSPARAWGSST
jgi:hypothetical protein